MSGFVAEERPDGLFIFRITALDNETIDDWVRYSQIIQNDFKTDGHLRVLYLSSGLKLPTPYATQRAIQLAAMTPPTLRSSSAVVLLSFHLQLAADYVLKRVHKPGNIWPVRSVKEGIAWLNERHAKYLQGTTLEY